MDFSALRAQTLGSGLQEEAVTVNTRALIDKVLARYSGEWTVLRELLQNAADAGASRVTVKFETLPSATVPLPQDSTRSNLLKHTVQHHTLKRLVVSNNGQPFNENDWTRLKRIAEGNPDETKIGAFGVGFYSVFADCEDPFVSSGREAMAFFWKQNSLYTRRLKLSEADCSLDTNFVLDYRDTTSSIPTLLPLAQFLANSLTFVGIQTIELWIDDHKILDLVKKTSPSYNVSIPRDIETKTSEGLMKVASISKEMAQIDGQWMPIIGWKSSVRNRNNRPGDGEGGPSLRKFFSRLAGTNLLDDASAAQTQQSAQESEDLTVHVKATVFLNVDTATIKTSTTAKFNEELERATKKPPPKQTRLAVLTAPYIENDTLATAAKAGDVFASGLPHKIGRIFIGFPTHQTTGLGAHISAPSVIPTVERESIDLNARYVRTWNMEMLRAAGIVCRIVWSAEMGALRDKIVTTVGGRTKIRVDDVLPVLKEGIATTQNFTFRESTPSAKTGQLLEDAFWTCSRKPSIEVLSTCGVLPTHDVRIAPKDLSFVEGVPVLPEQMVTEAKPFVDKLIEYGLVTDVTVSDIKMSLESSPLSVSQVTEFLAWATKQASTGKLDRASLNSLLAAAVANDDSDGPHHGLLVLANIKSFHNPSKIPVEMPVAATVMPFKYTRAFTKRDLELLGWEEIQIVPWVKWLLAESKNRNVLSESQDVTTSSDFSTQIFFLLSKQWDAIGQSSKTTIIDLLSSRTVMPTRFGLKKPGDTYFPNVKLFDDLPTVQGLGNVKEKVLVAFGVRKTVDLGVVFERLLGHGNKHGLESTSAGNHVALIQYLASVKNDIPRSDMHKLQRAEIFPKEDRESASKESSQKYSISQLFEPRQQFRDLGLPLLAWPGPYRPITAEGRFLSALGLMTTPHVADLIEIMADAGTKQDEALYDKAMAYFIQHHNANGYGGFDYSSIKTPFLPLEHQSTSLSTPSQCFLAEGATLLGFSILRRKLHLQAPLFGVRTHPPIDQCVDILARQPPTTQQAARAVFGYFSTRLAEISGTALSKLQDLNFVPLSPKNKEKTDVTRYTSPRNCFLGGSETFGEIFEYVDFGQEANSFLLKCGSKQEPSKIEVAQLLVREPARISSTFRNPEKYVSLLRSLAESLPLLKKNKDLFKEMKRAPFLLASKEILQPQTNNGKAGYISGSSDAEEYEEEETQGIREWQLTSAEGAIIVDDYISYNLFKTNILAAPQEESLEDFYSALGSPMLSSLVEEAAKHGPRSQDQRMALKLQKQILERSTLFLHEQNPDTIKHDTKWFEKNLSVQEVSAISLRRSLKGRNLSHVEKRSAVVTQVNREYILWVAGARPDLYQVSQALVHLLLLRPKLHSALTLEMLLKTDLFELRARGFNVGRILRQKAAEARMAETKRQEAFEAERKRLEEQERAWDESQKKMLQAQTGLPGGFPDSPDSKSLVQSSQHANESNHEDLIKSAQSWSSNLVRHLGLGRQQRHQVQPSPIPAPGPQMQLENGSDATSQAPPPYSETAPQSGSSAGGGGVGSVTAPHQLQQNLLNAIQKTRPHNSSGVFSRGGQNTVSETKSYCDEKPAHDLQFVADLKHSIQMFLPNAPGANAVSNSAFLAANSAGLMLFSDVLNLVGEVFILNHRSLNIFNEVGGKTIAFNRNGSIFCNYLYFKQLHEHKMQASTTDPAAESEAIVYWWVILCHELAHNLVQDHSSDHSYYTEGFVAQYFNRVVQKVGERAALRQRQTPVNTQGLQAQEQNLLDA